MYRLVLFLPFNITIALRSRYPDKESAASEKANLPNGFAIMPQEDVEKLKVIEVPFR